MPADHWSFRTFYDGKDKTFWFFSWEGFRLRTGSAFTTTVPDPKTEI